MAVAGLALGAGDLAGGDPGLCLVQAARRQVGVTVLYDGSYRRLAYPGGDVPPDRGVCTDVLIRAYRALGLDLQVRVHEDRRNAPQAYPDLGADGKPDPSIDHRRVRVLAVFFRRHGLSLPVSSRPGDYLPGDLVTWILPSGSDHIGIVSDRRSAAGVPWILHNIGAGTREEDLLFAHPITGHFRYFPAELREACERTQGP
jgi:uncharacterized protein YijF (DUF1287 family)